MLIRIPGLLDAAELRRFRQELDAAEWESGLATAGQQAAAVKDNMQLPLSSPEGDRLGRSILHALSQNALFLSAAVPARILPPMFNRYSGGQTFGAHVDNAIRVNPLTGERLRTDLSCTLFLADPSEYDGGELLVEDLYGAHRVKLAAGDLVLYPAKSLHRVTPVTRGTRLASFFWLQSVVRDDHDRTMLFELDQSIQSLSTDGAQHDMVVRLTGLYHNLIRKWAEV